ncbi:MAG: hypothetical protein ACIAQZ_08605 [Sedimentisphaeraceae bacterium JB056]
MDEQEKTATVNQEAKDMQAYAPEKRIKMKPSKRLPLFNKLMLIFFVFLLFGAGFIGLKSLGFVIDKQFVGSYDLEFVGHDIQDYAHKHNGQFPPADSWNDVLLEDEDTSSGSFGFEDYAINPEAVRLGPDAPDDMVLLFSITPEGENVSGGLELMQKNKWSRSHILFVNYDRKWVRKSKASYLRWGLDRNIEPNESNIGRSSTILSITCLVPFLFILSGCIRYFRKYALSCLLITAASMGLGAYLGFAAEDALYRIYSLDDFTNSGWIIGAISGAMVAVCYMLLLARKAEKCLPDIGLIGYGTMSGVPAGVICAAVTHGYLMVFYEEFNLAYLGIGIGFGAVAGIVLGFLGSWLVTLSCRKRLAAAHAVDESGGECANESS